MVQERDQIAVDSFTEFVKQVEPRLRRALPVAYGIERGAEATADALAYAWENWERIEQMDNPAGYLYRVGRSRARPRKQLRPTFPGNAGGQIAAGGVRLARSSRPPHREPARGRMDVG